MIKMGIGKTKLIDKADSGNKKRKGRNRMRNGINEYKKRVNPGIAKDIENLIKPYWELIDKSSDYYKLRTLAIDVDKLNIKVKKEVENLLLMFKIAAKKKIKNKIESLHDKDRDSYSLRDIKIFLNKHNLSQKYLTLIFYSIYGSNMVNLGLEDFKFITENAGKAKCNTFEIDSFSDGSFDKFMKSNLKGMKNAILFITGRKDTTLDDLCCIWENTLKQLPPNSRTAFAYKVDNVKNVQLSLLAVK